MVPVRPGPAVAALALALAALPAAEAAPLPGDAAGQVRAACEDASAGTGLEPACYYAWLVLVHACAAARAFTPLGAIVPGEVWGACYA